MMHMNVQLQAIRLFPYGIRNGYRIVRSLKKMNNNRMASNAPKTLVAV